MRIKRLSEMTAADWAAFPDPYELTPEELAEVYRLSRESFTAADLQEFTELDEGVLADEFLADLEAILQEYDQKKLDDLKQS